jgi:hypothetical protein
MCYDYWNDKKREIRRNFAIILWLRSNLTVRVELPGAREYEALLKAVKEKKARNSVPQF